MSDFHQYNNVATHAIPLVLSLFLGAWSDRRGRKLPLLLGLAGKLYYSTMVVINALQGKKKKGFSKYFNSSYGSLKTCSLSNSLG